MRIFDCMRECEKEIRQDGFISSQRVVDLFCENLEAGDDMENNIIEGLFQVFLDELSARFNDLTLQNGEGYIIDRNANAVKEFLKCVEIDNCDDVWLEYIKIKNGKTKQLREFAWRD